MNLFELSIKIKADTSQAEKGIKSTQKSCEILTGKTKVMSAQFSEVQKNIDNLTKQYDKSVKKTGETSQKTQELSQKLNDAKESLETAKNKLALLSYTYASAKGNVADLTKEFNKSVKESGVTSEQTQELAKKLDDAEKEAEQAKNALDSYNSELAETETKAEKSSGSLSKLASILGKGIATAAKVGTAAVGTAMAGIAALTTAGIKSFAEYEQLAGGAQKIFDEMDYSKIEQDAQNAYKTLNISANEYLATINDVGATFAATMGDEAGYLTAQRGLQAIADYASGTGKSVDVLSEKFTLITRSTSSYQSIADQFSGILPATSKDFLKQAQAAGFLSTKYKELTKVPVAEYQQALSKMLEKGVEDLGLAGNTAAETANTITGSLAASKAAWSNLVAGFADDNADFEILVGNFVETLVGDGQGNGGVINNIVPRVETAMQGAGKMIEELMPIIIDTVPQIVTEWLPKILESGISIVSSIYDGIKENHGAIIDGAMETVWTLIDTITDPETLADVLATGIDIVLEIADGLIEGLPDLIEKIPEIVSAIIDEFSEHWDDWVDIGGEIMSGIWEGMKSSLKFGLVGVLVSKFKEEFRQTGSGRTIDGGSFAKNGSHAGGLRSVPFDGYIAELHQGERVLTREEASGYNRGEKSQINIYQTIQSKPMTAADLMMQARYQAEQAVFLSV